MLLNICLFQDSELIECVEEEGKDDSDFSPMSDDRPKVQVSKGVLFCIDQLFVLIT